MEGQDAKPLPEAEIKQKLVTLPGWTYADNKISKVFELPSFTEAVELVRNLVDFCNSIDHHPDITINYKKVHFELTRYSIGGKVTARDFVVANKIEQEYAKIRSKFS